MVDTEILRKAQAAHQEEMRNWTIGPIGEVNLAKGRWIASRAERYDFAETEFKTFREAHQYRNDRCWEAALKAIGVT